jgi:hypothetical protein
MSLTLTVIEGPHQGRQFTLTGHDTFVVGRSPDAHFALADQDRYFSRHHFLIEFNPPLCRLVDLRSRNRTYVNGQPVETADLRDGDTIKAGHTVLRVRLESAPEPRPALPAEAVAVVDAQAQAAGWESSAVVGSLRELQFRQWRDGQRLPVEAYLEQWPALAANAEGVLELIYGEYCLREEAGERPPHDEFGRRFPQHADALGRLFLLHDALVANGQGDKETRGQGEKDGLLPLSPCPLVPLSSPIPGYHIEHELGRGAMGVVYRARHESSGETVAIKTILPAARPHPAATARFLRETAILRQLSHPHIVAFRESGEADGLLYFVTEYVAGKDAARIVRESGPLAIDRAVNLVCQLLDALAYAHERGFVHRDVKPSNLLITEEDGREVLKLADFGLARAYQESPLSGLTLLGTSGGTPAFMPPEQVLNFRDAQPASDQYSAAATLYYLLTAWYVHDPAPTQAEMFRRILQDEPVPIRARRPAVPSTLACVIDQATRWPLASRLTSLAQAHGLPFSSQILSAFSESAQHATTITPVHG